MSFKYEILYKIVWKAEFEVITAHHQFYHRRTIWSTRKHQWHFVAIFSASVEQHVFILFGMRVFCCHLPFGDFINFVSIFVIDWVINLLLSLSFVLSACHLQFQIEFNIRWLPSVWQKRAEMKKELQTNNSNSNILKVQMHVNCQFRYAYFTSNPIRQDC